MNIFDSLSEFATEKVELKKILKNINKEEGLSERQKVFKIIKAVLVEAFQDVSLQCADIVNPEDPEIYFIFIDGQLTATADLVDLDGMQMLSLNFHVQVLANKAIRVYNIINRYLNVTVVSHSVFFPVDNKTTTKLVYNQTAVQKYTEKMYKDMREKITEIKEAAKEADMVEGEFH